MSRADHAHAGETRDLGVEGLAMFDTMSRAGDHPTSIAAARCVSEISVTLRQAVLDAFRELGPMTDGALESLPRFSRYGPSTIRKRRSELYHDRLLIADGTALVDKPSGATSRMTVWRVPT